VPAALTDDQKNVATPTTIGDAPNALYDTYHNDAADSVSVDSDHKHTTLQAQTRPIHRTHNTTTPQTTKSHNHDPLNEQTQPTIKSSDGSLSLSHGQSSAIGYLPPFENDMGTLFHPMSTASSQIANTCWTPPIKINNRLLAYSRPGQTTSPQSHPYNTQSTNEGIPQMYSDYQPY
jgi:hypothetical protein